MATDSAFAEEWERLDMSKLKAQAKPSLLEKVKSIPPKYWLDRLTPEQRTDAIELRRAWRAGEVLAGPVAVHEAFVAFMGGEVVGRTQFREFLGKKPKEAA